MSAIELRKILLLSVLLVVVILYPLTTFAMVATSSDAKELPVSTFSNALPSQDYMESDDFDTLDFVPFSDAGMPSVSNTVSYTGLRLVTEYYDMHGVLREAFVPFNSEFYASIGLPNDCVSVLGFRVRLLKASLPASGTYKMYVRFGSNTGLEYYDCYVNSTKGNSNAAPQYNDAYINFVQQSGDWYTDLNIDVGSVNFIDVGVHVKDTATTVYPYGGYVSVSFIKTTVSPDYTTAGGSQTSQDVQSNIADNTAQQVEQGDTIIELIKNTIQTISSQLTAFWNQLAGEFTNLYNKMNQQHLESMDKVDEQIDNDNTNTDKVTTAIESHGNFIIEGLKKLFIPSDEYFKAYFDDLYSWFSERFGFLSFPIDLLLEVIDIFVNSSQTDCVLVLPSFTIMENLLWPEMSFNLTVFLNTNFSFVVVAIKTVTSIYLVMAFVQLCEEKWNEVMMN